MTRYNEVESNILEFKRELPRNSQILKTIIGFCNTFGGKLVLGVDDDGEVVGMPENQLDDLITSLEQSIFEACSPSIIPRIYVQRIENKSVLLIEVSEGMNKPYYLRSEGMEKGTYVRLNKHTVQAKSDLIKELSWNARGIDYEQLPVYQATLEDLDENAIKRFLQIRKNNGMLKINDSVLKSYGIISYDQSKRYPTVLGIIIFGRNPQQYISEAMIICSHFRGLEGREAIAHVDCEGTLFNQYEQAYTFIINRLYKSFKITGSKREEELEIPEVAIREALLNLIVHRNYHLKSPAKIAIYDDRVEFFSPGQIPGQIDITNLLSGISYLRNPAICKIFREANYIEKLGSGLITIFKSYQRMGLKQPIVIDGGTYVKCILYRIKKENDNLGNDDISRIKKLFNSKYELSAREISQLLDIPHTTVIRRINSMIASGIIIKFGTHRNIKYRMNN